MPSSVTKTDQIRITNAEDNRNSRRPLHRTMCRAHLPHRTSSRALQNCALRVLTKSRVCHNICSVDSHKIKDTWEVAPRWSNSITSEIRTACLNWTRPCSLASAEGTVFLIKRGSDGPERDHRTHLCCYWYCYYVRSTFLPFSRNRCSSAPRSSCVQKQTARPLCALSK